MNGIDRALIDDVRSLLAAFASSGARTFSTSLRDGVGLMIRREKPESHDGKLVVAPHIATVLTLPQAGAVTGAGITLAVLGEEIFVKLDGVDLVVELLVSVGDLVEFGSPLVRLHEPA